LKANFILESLRDDLVSKSVVNALGNELENFFNLIKYFTAAVYGLLAAYYLYLFLGDIFAGYQPTFIFYLIIFVCIGSLIYIATFSNLAKQLNQFKVYKRYLQFFSYSLCGIISALLIFSLSIPPIVVKATNMLIKQSELSISKTNLEYCIQIRTSLWSRERYQEIETLLDLSPLTMQSKADIGSSYGWGKPYFHGMLIVQKHSLTNLYNWSYKQRKWSYLEPGFAKRASIDEPSIVCTPKSNYLQQIPWIFP
jgi:hypothetical protein